MEVMIKTHKNLEVRKPEVLVKKTRYKLGTLAIKFLNTIIANLKKDDGIDEKYILKVKDFKELTRQKTKRIYELIEEALKELLENPLKIPLNEEETDILMCNWVSSARYNEGQISFRIDPELRPILLQVKEKFLKYRLENILQLKSNYVIRIYEFLKDIYNMYSSYGHKIAEEKIKVDELREMLEIPKSYRYPDIKRQILEKAQKELAEHTDIIFDFQEIKTGRKVTHLKFVIQENPKKNEDYLFNQEIQNLKSIKHFVAYLRKNYSGNLKFFGYKTIDNVGYWVGLNNKGLVYGLDNNGNKKDFNAIESQRIYDTWYQIAKIDPNYYLVLEKQEDFKDVFNADPEFRMSINSTIRYLQDEGKLK